MAGDWQKLLLALLQPLTVAVALAVIAMLLRAPVLRALALAALLVLYGLSTPSLSGRFAQTLTVRYAEQPASEYATAQAIVLLGGGVRAVGGIPGAMDARAGIDRVHFAAELWRTGRAPTVVATGGDGSSWTEAHAMRDLLIDLGVPPAAIKIEPQARNTRQHPERVATLLAAPTQPVLLVTSAQHMPRAVANFRAAGMNVLPAPTDFERLDHGDARDWLPDTLALDQSTRVLKEYAGLLHLRLFGRARVVAPAAASHSVLQPS